MQELSACLTAAEENHWLAFYKIDPWGEERADMRSAKIAELIHNTNVSKKEHRKTLTDFMPFYRKRQKKDPNIRGSVLSVFGKLKRKE